MNGGESQPQCIRQFEPSDIEGVIAINRTSLPENYPDQFFLGLHYHAPKGFLVAIMDGRIVGYIMCRIERGISSFGRFPVKKGHIVSIAVADEYRHHGLGTKLIKAGMEGMASYGAAEFFLEVRKANEAATGIYEKLGYDIKRVLKGYYRDGEDAYLMIKKHASNAEEVAARDTQD
ncbi:MAG: ribosomal protein S18-alanine N-acetyltransferase [Candidatus Thorarchaeota archaeon]|jgi:ribosomal-protein-alanine N-acetyltransferase|nr:ribosomal protein S18-alanine N-acetyltransferase [Candidatus Thorarchaeota archaeon]